MMNLDYVRRFPLDAGFSVSEEGGEAISIELASQLPELLADIGLTVEDINATADPNDADGAANIILDLLHRYIEVGITSNEIENLFSGAGKLCSGRADKWERMLVEDTIKKALEEDTPSFQTPSKRQVARKRNDAERFARQFEECQITVDTLREFYGVGDYCFVDTGANGEFGLESVDPRDTSGPGRMPAFFSLREVRDAAKAFSEELEQALKDNPDIETIDPRMHESFTIDALLMRRMHAVFALFLCDGRIDGAQESELALCLELWRKS
jgi:ketosteroid isomerase-like protein